MEHIQGELLSKARQDLRRKLGLSEERWVKKDSNRGQNNTYMYKEIARWRRRENLKNYWNRMRVKDIKKCTVNNSQEK